MLTGIPEAASVAALQANLLAVLPETLLIVDGIFGRETQQAVRIFQAREGLPVTGLADLLTWELLDARAALARIEQEEAEALRLVLLPGQRVSHGEKNLHLYMVQGMLTALGEIYENLPAVVLTGELDRQTVECLQMLQELYGLSATGELDKHTWRMLARDYRHTVADGNISHAEKSAAEKQ